MATYAQIKNGKVVNIIVLNDPELIPHFTKGFDELVEYKMDVGGPGPGWHYQKKKDSLILEENPFIPPPEIISKSE